MTHLLNEILVYRFSYIQRAVKLNYFTSFHRVPQNSFQKLIILELHGGSDFASFLYSTDKLIIKIPGVDSQVPPSEYLHLSCEFQFGPRDVKKRENIRNLSETPTIEWSRLASNRSVYFFGV